MKRLSRFVHGRYERGVDPTVAVILTIALSVLILGPVALLIFALVNN